MRVLPLIGVLLLLCSAVAAAGADTGAPAGMPDPYELYAASVKAMRAADAAGKPAYLTYKLSCDLHNLEIKPSTDKDGTTFDWNLVHANNHYDYQVWYRSIDGNALSQDLLTHVQYQDSVFAPDSFTMDDESGGASPRPWPSPTPGTQFGSPPSLGKLSVYGNRYYRISMVGLENVDGSPAYHLHLESRRRDDSDHPLTDLWIDPATKLIHKARASYALRDVAFGGGGDGEVIFGPVGKYWLATGFDVHAAGYALFWHANIGMVVRASNILAFKALPDAYFGGPPSPSPSPATHG